MNADEAPEHIEKTGSSRLARWTATVTVLVLAFGFIPGIAIASHFVGSGGLVGGFEIDGDFVNTGSNKDWNNVGGVSMVTDAASPASDDIFTGGSKEEGANGPDTWEFDPNGSVPGKTDFTRLYFASQLTPTNTAVLWLGFERLDVEGNGDAHINFELNQDASTIINSKSVAVPKRTAGDLLVVYDYDGGDKPDSVAIEIREWTGSALGGNWSTPLSAPTASAVGDVNAVTGTARPAGAPFGGGTVNQKRFGEVGIDLLRFYPTYFSSCRSFSTFWAKSRASGESFNSALKDKTRRQSVDLNTCDANISISPQSATNEVGTTHTFTGHVNVKPGTSFVNAPTGTVINFVKVSGPGTFGATSCTTTDGSGSCSVTMTSSTPGATVVKASTDVTVGATALHRETDGTGTNGSAATKNWHNYRVALTPPNATNAVGSTHTFTAKLERDTGSGWAALGGATLNLTLDPGGTNAALVEINGAPASGTSGSCTTAGDGTCSIKINSTTTGGVTLTAVYGTTLDSGPLSRSATTNKLYVDFRLDVTPARATNEAGTTHTFTVSLDRDAGSGFQDFAGQTVTLTLTPGLTNAHFVEINGSAASGTSGTCVTDGSGQCSVKIFSSVPGAAQLTAQYDTALDSGTVSLQKSANKDYVDFRLRVTPPNATNEVGTTHTFTVALDRGTGSGFGAYAGQTVTLTLDPGVSDAHFVEINGSASSGTSATCVTDGSGDCTVKIFASTPGGSTLTAGWSTTIDSGTVNRSASATKQYNDYRLNLTPPSSTNEVGTTHRFIALLERDLGSGWLAFPGRTVTLTLTPGSSDAHFVAINGSASSGTSATCVTRTDGTCEVQIFSTQAGAVGLTATWKTTLDSGTVTRTDSAAKQYNDYRLEVTPPNATNEVGTTHTFSVGLGIDTGNGFAAFSGQTVTLTLTPGVTDGRFVRINGVAASGTTATCVTTVIGTCTVEILATTPGSISLNASWGTTLDSGAVNRSDSASKQYNDYRLSLNPPSATNEVGTAHTFTALLERNTGSGFAAYAGQTATLTLTPGVSDAHFTSINGSASSGTSATCTTASNGTCEIVIGAAQPGSVGLSATWKTALDSGTVTRMDTAAKQYNDYALTVDPPTAVNEVDDPHTFTITLTRDTGSGHAGYGGQSVTLTLDPGASDAHFTSINGSAASGTSGSCTTNGSGVCTVIVTAGTAGTVSLSARWGTILDSGNVTRQNSGTKHYVDAAIQIAPDAVNEVGDPHAFYVTMTAYPAGAKPVSFVAITPTVSPAPDGGVVSTCGSPGVSGNVATCSVTVNSSSDGRFTANAAGTVSMGGVAVTRSTSGNSGPGGSGPANKDYVDASVAIGPSEAVNPIGTAHTFAITVTAHSGQAGPTTFQSIVPSVSPSPDGGSSTTCGSPAISGNSAVCMFTITSTVAGTFSADVTAIVKVGGVTMTRSTTENAGPAGSGRAIKHYIGIELTKTGPTLAHVGDTVTYTMTATNPSQIPLGSVTLTDPKCDAAPTPASGDANADLLLDPSETWAYTCTRVIRASDGDPVPNEATVSGSALGLTVTDKAAWQVDVIHPSITIVKTANPVSGAPGDPVTYTYVVTNDGDTTLFNISVDDDKLGHIGDIASLAAGVSATLQRATTLGSAGVTNIGTVKGTDVLGASVTDSDDATVSVVLPFTITRTLPKTGTELVPPVAISLMLIILGAMCVHSGRSDAVERKD